MKRLLFSLFLFLGATSGLVFSQVAPIPLIKGSTLDCLDGVSPSAAIIRQYNDTLILMCTRGQNKYDFSLRNTNTGEILVFEMWDRIQGVTMHLDNGAPDVYYKVNDVRISKDMCYFSGDIKEVHWEEEYDLTGSFHMVPSYYDCGYVGRFHIDDIFNSRLHYEMAQMDDVVSLTRLWVEDYQLYLGDNTDCENSIAPYVKESELPDTLAYMIGVPKDTSRYATSCAIEMWRGQYDSTWRCKMHYPMEKAEVLNDVIGTNDYIVMSSRFKDKKVYGENGEIIFTFDSRLVGIRVMRKEVPMHTPCNQLWVHSVAGYRVNDSTIGFMQEGELARLCRMRNNSFYVVSAYDRGAINGVVLINSSIGASMSSIGYSSYLLRNKGSVKDVAYNWKQDDEPFSLLINSNPQRILMGDFNNISSWPVNRLLLNDSTRLNSITPHHNGLAIWYGGRMHPSPNVRCYQGMQRVSAVRKSISCSPLDEPIKMIELEKNQYEGLSRGLDDRDIEYSVERYVSEVRKLKSRNVCDKIERDIVIK